MIADDPIRDMPGWVRDLNQSDSGGTAAENHLKTVGSLAPAALIRIVGDHRRDDAASEIDDSPGSTGSEASDTAAEPGSGRVPIVKDDCR